MARRWSVPALGAFVALLSVFLLATALAPVSGAIPNPTNKKFYACFNKKTRVVKMLNFPKVSTCPKRHKLIKWNAKGNPGAAGPAGPAGPQGPVAWSQITGVPPKVLAGDTTRSYIAATSSVIPVGNGSDLFVEYPVGLDVKITLIPVTDLATFTLRKGGADLGEELFYRQAGKIYQFLYLKHDSGPASAVKVRVTVWNDSYLSPSAVKQKVKVTFLKNPKKALKKLRKRR